MGKNKIAVSLVIPAYNDEAVIIDQLRRCEKIIKDLSNNYEIIICDDKSKDNTFSLIKKNFENNNRYKILQNKKNMGITKNVHQLYMMAKKDFVLFYSADGDWNPKDIGNLINTQLKTGADIIIGKRKKKIGYTYYRRFISTMHRLLPLIFFGIDTIDPGGIKLIRKTLVHEKLISKSQFFEAEIIIRAKRNGYKISYYPVIYKKPRKGAGYGGAFKSATDSFIDLLRLRFSII